MKNAHTKYLLFSIIDIKNSFLKKNVSHSLEMLISINMTETNQLHKISDIMQLYNVEVIRIHAEDATIFKSK